MKGTFDQRAETQLFVPGDQVLALLPVNGSQFLASITGPCTVKSRMSDMDYMIVTPDKRKKVQWCHVKNLVCSATVLAAPLFINLSKSKWMQVKIVLEQCSCRKRSTV